MYCIINTLIYSQKVKLSNDQTTKHGNNEFIECHTAISLSVSHILTVKTQKNLKLTKIIHVIYN